MRGHLQEINLQGVFALGGTGRLSHRQSEDGKRDEECQSTYQYGGNQPVGQILGHAEGDADGE
jgi:hypothetical protein